MSILGYGGADVFQLLESVGTNLASCLVQILQADRAFERLGCLFAARSPLIPILGDADLQG
ncbi:MAG: hypothetical protein JNL97_06920 [Verrucomicrobiales bacterium]|nr:hypothetical protein [Verrucomicrobiales bacterium]